MQNIKLAIFDLDGVITSTTEEHYEAWTHLFAKHFDIKLDPKWEVYTKGVSRIESFEILLKHAKVDIDDPKLIECLANEKNKIYQELISDFDETKICAGVVKVLDFLKQKHIKIALGSASKNAPYLIKNLKLESYFDYIVNPEGKDSKPSPDIFLDAVTHFDVKPNETIAFEDAKAGVKAIKNAGVYAIGVGEEDLSEADIKVSTLEELTSSILENMIRGN